MLLLRVHRLDREEAEDTGEETRVVHLEVEGVEAETEGTEIEIETLIEECRLPDVARLPGETEVGVDEVDGAEDEEAHGRGHGRVRDLHRHPEGAGTIERYPWMLYITLL